MARRLLGEGLLDKLHQLAILIHLSHDVAPTDKLATDENLQVKST